MKHSKTCSHYKVIHIGSELIHIVCIHTGCALTTIHTECAFGQSSSIGSFEPL